MKKKICGIATKAVTIHSFMTGNLNYMVEKGYEAYCICNPDTTLTQGMLGKVIPHPIKMKWGNVSPFEVVKCVFKMYRFFRKEKIQVIQYATANAGLYASIAGWLAGVPVRIFLQWGIAYPDYTGFRLWFYKTMEKITCLFATSVQPDSKANLQFAIDEKLFRPSKGSVIFNGSACGVNMQRFDMSSREKWRTEIRGKYNIPADAMLVGFVGRVVPEKGINELLEAFDSIKDKHCYLMLVGSTEEVSRLNVDLYNKSLAKDNVIYTGQVNNAPAFFSAFDFLVLPSYREGFGMVVLESAAMGTPSIISNIKGPTDFVQDGLNGLVCDVKSVESLRNAMERAINMGKEEYEDLCHNAYLEVKTHFDSELFKEEFFKNREFLLQQARNK